MMWAMMLCCAIPLILILFFGLGSRALGASTWVTLAGVALMLVAHFFIINRSHRHPAKEGEGDEENKNNQEDKTHSDHNCCH